MASDASGDLRPIVTAGAVLGIGLGGFFDGILFHQILQLHSMLSARLPRTTIPNLEINMFWDGLFHAATWTSTVVGTCLLWNAARRPNAVLDTRVFVGGLAFGSGAFNLVEGVIDHHLLGLHHVFENAANPLPADLAFLASGVVLMAVGVLLIQRARRSQPPLRALTPIDRPPARAAPPPAAPAPRGS